MLSCYVSRSGVTESASRRGPPAFLLCPKSRIVDLLAGRRANPRGEAAEARRVRLIAVNRQLVQSDAVITAYRIASFVRREAAGDARLRQPLRIPAGFLLRDRPYHDIAAGHVCDPAVFEFSRVGIFTITADHVFTKSWYPDTTQPTVQRWTAPSCPECNRELGRLEKDLLIRLVLCVNPKSEAASGLTEKVLRSLGLDTDQLPEEEKARRDNLRARIRAELMPSAAVAEKPEARIPGLGPRESAEWSIPIPWASLSIIAEKIVRGCEYNIKGRYLELPYGIRTFVDGSNVLPEPYASYAKGFDLGPGCTVRRLFAAEDPNVVLYWISVWGTLHLGACIALEDDLAKLDQRSSRVEGIEPGKAMKISPYLRGHPQSL